MEQVPTVKELIDKIDEDFYKKNSYYLSISNPEKFAKTIAIKFAKLHVEAALKAATEKGKTSNGTSIVLKDSVLNSYPLENIK